VKAALPSHTDTFLWDPELRGFGIKITPKGAKTYVLQYRMGGRGTPTRRYTIGTHGSPWTPATAREEAQRLLLQVKRGVDPQLSDQQRRREEVSLRFEEYAERYLSQHGKRWSTKTLPTVKSNFKNWITPALRGRSLRAIRKPDIVAMLDRIEEESPDRVALARNVYAHARKLFSWAVSRGDIDHNPFEGLEPPRGPASRERVLNDRELAAVWQGTLKLGKPFGPMIRLLIITGQRREEVAAIDWSELDRSSREWTLPAGRSKNGKAHTVPLSELAIAALDELAGGSEWPEASLIFSTTGKTAASGHSRAKLRLDAILKNAADDPSRKAHKLAPWRIHDLRRTFATGLQRLGVRLEVTEACLNHVSGSRRGIVGVYQRHQWAEEKRSAFEAWGAHLTALNREAGSVRNAP
jgi:integrase